VFEIGTSLRDARLRRGIELSEAEQATKIRSKYLHSLEEEDFDLLPGPTYVKGFLRTYADYLGLDGQLYCDEYNSRYAVVAEEPPRVRRPSSARARQQRRVERNIVVLGLLGIAIATALVIAAWKFGGTDGQQASPGAVDVGVRPQAHTLHRFVIRALGTGSRLDVRRSTPAGQLLWSGTLERGETQRFTAAQLWLQVARRKAVRVSVDGIVVKLPGRRSFTGTVGADAS
jgi:hypothetical protein